MWVDYINCQSCGYEDFEMDVDFSRTTASGDLYVCPRCEEETSDVIIEE